jgi:hypothetical protein
MWANRVTWVAWLMMNIGRRVHYADQLAQSTENALHYEPPHLAVDSANHNYSKLQHEGQLSLCCLGSPVVDGFVVGSLCERTSDKVSGRTSVLRVLSPR